MWSFRRLPLPDFDGLKKLRERPEPETPPTMVVTPHGSSWNWLHGKGRVVFLMPCDF